MKKALFFTLLLFAGFLHAQTSVELKDIAVGNEIRVDTLTGLPVETDYETLVVQCKINELQSGQVVHLLIGTAPDSGDIAGIQAVVTEADDAYYLTFSETTIPIENRQLRITGVLSEEEYAFHTDITLYLVDTNGEETNRLYFTK